LEKWKKKILEKMKLSAEDYSILPLSYYPNVFIFFNPFQLTSEETVE